MKKIQLCLLLIFAGIFVIFPNDSNVNCNFSFSTECGEVSSIISEGVLTFSKGMSKLQIGGSYGLYETDVKDDINFNIIDLSANFMYPCMIGNWGLVAIYKTNATNEGLTNFDLSNLSHIIASGAMWCYKPYLIFYFLGGYDFSSNFFSPVFRTLYMINESLNVDILFPSYFKINYIIDEKSNAIFFAEIEEYEICRKNNKKDIDFLQIKAGMEYQRKLISFLTASLRGAAVYNINTKKFSPYISLSCGIE